MFSLHLPDKETAMLILYYAQKGAEATPESLIEAPRIKELSEQTLNTLRKS